MNIKRILVFALVLMIMVMPIGFAEGGYGALTLSNFHLEAPGMEAPLDIDAALKIGVGAQEDGSGRVDVALTGGGQQAFSASAGFDKDKVQAVIGGSNYLFETTMEELQKVMSESAGATGANTDAPGGMKPEDMQRIKDLVTNYSALIKKYSDPAVAAKYSAQILAVMNVKEAGVEQVELFDQSMELNRYDFTMTAEDIGKLYQAIYAVDPDMKKLMKDYFSLIEDLSGEKMPFDPDNMGESFAAMFKEENVELKMDMSIWTDTKMAEAKEANAVKEDITISVTAPKTGALTPTTDDAAADAAETATPEMQTVTFPITVEVLKSDAGTQVSYAMSVTPPEESGTLDLGFEGTFEAPDGNGGTASKGEFTMNFDDVGTASDVNGTMSFDAAMSADGLANCSFKVSGTGEGQTFDLGIGYEGKTATQTEKTGAMTIDFNIPGTGAGVFSCDVALETSALTPFGEAEAAGKTVIDPMTATEEEMAAVETELQGVVMQAMGVLMQTPGLSNIMGSMMNAGTAG